MLASFRASVLKARCGAWDFNPKKVMPSGAMSFVGGQTANAVIAFLLISLVLGVVVFLLAWSLTWSLVETIITTPQLLIPLVTFLGSFVGNFIVNMLCKKYIEGKVNGNAFIRRLGCW